MTEQIAFQDQYLLERADCWGCGYNNNHGIQIKSFWEGEEAVAHVLPRPYFTGHKGVVNGGIIATLMDCHCMGLAMAAAHKADARQIGTEPLISYVTASLKVNYLKPTPLTAEPLELRARIIKVEGRKTFMQCTLFAQGEETANGEVLGVRINEVPQV